ncbi:endonuclease domain-containing 1 protein-like [Thunnus thynnus]|uniref:endonuclease domain-containing 1 protein-like n=1 Tax=Thunnus thynnus TaxID=8237 RepID=UPI003527A1AA
MKLLVSSFLLLVLSYPATAEVVESFTTCEQFFFKSQPPTEPSGVQYKKICQKTEDGYQFATLYDTNRRIPVYSAYKFQGRVTYERKDKWLIEPKLDDQNGGDFMASGDAVKTGLGTNQALKADYRNSDYDKGHLLPGQHRHSQPSADATFTLTNVAPQVGKFNQGPWNEKETKVADTLTTKCLNSGFHAYIVTGVVPGNTNIKKRVNVPSYFWSAFCCGDNNDKPKLSGAYYGDNVESGNINEIEDLEDLDTKLSKDYGYTFKVFSDKCKQAP